MYLAEQELSLNTAVISVQAGLAEIAQGQTDVDLSAVTTVDSSAVAVMLEWQRAATAVGKTIIFHRVPVSLTSLIALYGVTDFLNATPSERH